MTGKRHILERLSVRRIDIHLEIESWKRIAADYMVSTPAQIRLPITLGKNEDLILYVAVHICSWLANHFRFGNIPV